MIHLRMNGGDLNTSINSSHSDKNLNNISIYLRAYKLVLTNFPFNHFLRENPLDEVGEHSLFSFGNLSAMQFAPIELETLADDIL